MSASFTPQHQEYDKVIQDITDYVLNMDISSDRAYDTAYYCFLDTLGCGLEALEYPACKKMLGPVVREPLSRTVQKYQVPNSSWIRFRRPSISVP